MQHLIKLVCGTLLVMGACAQAQAQNFPSRPVTLIVPWLPGSSLAQKTWRQSIDHYPKHVQEKFRNERALIERLGLLAK